LVLIQRQMAAMGLESDNGIDVTLLRRAKAAGKPVAGFETMEQQMEMLQPRDDAEDIEALRLTLKEMDETPGMIDDLIAAWLDGDEDVLAHYLVDKVQAEDPKGYERIMVERNRRWVPQIETLLKGKGTVFIAVGTGHLVGPDSVIALLRQDGVKVQAVKTDR
ncbi:MAG: TraB/GumN family protein, partial [Asticcacaulis sp.]|nr:TraB/GumN family protein [Asticcacaulis sp.]